MITLTTYRGVVEKDGRTIHLRQADALPAGADVVVMLAQPLPSLEEQVRRLEALSLEEWRKPFEALEASCAQKPAEADIADITDDELAALVHQARQESA